MNCIRDKFIHFTGHYDYISDAPSGKKIITAMHIQRWKLRMNIATEHFDRTKLPKTIVESIQMYKFNVP